jgi:hypothetical protein
MVLQNIFSASAAKNPNSGDHARKQAHLPAASPGPPRISHDQL